MAKAGVIQDSNFLRGVCACCAQEVLQSSLRAAIFPPKTATDPPAWLQWNSKQWRTHRDSWYDQVHEVLDVERYLLQCFSVDDRVRDADTALLDAEDALANAADVTIAQRALTVAKAFSHRVRNWRDLTRTDMRADAVPAPSDNEARWLLFGAHTMPPTLTFSEESSIHCHLCESCVPWLTRLDSHQKPCVRMPPLARARNMWTSPEPSAIRCLTAAERRIIRLGRLYSTVKRVTAHDVPWGRDHPEALPQYSTKNAIAFLQNPDSAVRTLCVLPDDLAKDFYLQFEGNDTSHVLREPAVQVDIHKLRSAMWWFSTHCYQWIEATKSHELLAFDQLGDELEYVLRAYRQSLDGQSAGVPQTLLEVATQIASDKLTVQHVGPVDAGHETSGDDDSDGSHDSQARCQDKRNYERNHAHMDSSMVVASTGLEEAGPLSLWAKAMDKYDVLRQLKEQYDAAEKNSDDGAMQAAAREEAHCLAEAVHALRSLASSETRKQLNAFREHVDGQRTVLRVGHENKLLNTFSSEWWVCVFTDLFYRGDFIVPKGLGLRQWVHLLLHRVDFSGWMLSKDFAAVSHNLIIRRKQMWNVYKYMTTGAGKHMPEVMHALADVRPTDFVASALAAGDAPSIRAALRKRNVEPKVRSILRSMDVALRGVEGSESERDIFRFKFIGLHIWSGCSLLFFTLNPHDIHNPLLLVFLGPEGSQHERISLDWDDKEMARYYDAVEKGNRYRLHTLATQRPDAAARCVHWTFERVLEVLFNCAPAANVKPREMHTDSIPARCEPGLVAYVASKLGIVEPQMRLTEHMHMLIQILGFTNPRQFFKDGAFVDQFRRIWSYVASVCFMSQEAAALQIDPVQGLDVLKDEPLMPVRPGQLKKIGHEVTRQYESAQGTARGIDGTPRTDLEDVSRKASVCTPPLDLEGFSRKAGERLRYPTWMPRMYRNRKVSAQTWARAAIKDCNAGANKCANHVCLPRT